MSLTFRILLLATSSLLCWCRVGAIKDCVLERGKLGNWIQDNEHAAQAQYNEPLHHVTGRTDARFNELVEKGEVDTKFRSPTTWVWKDEHDECAITRVERIGFCHLMEKLAVKRLFFLGDELTQEQAISLWMLLEPFDPTTIESDAHMDLTVHCYSGYTFQIVFVRNDELLQTPVDVSLETGKGNCCPSFSSYCYPWFQEYAGFEGRTITIANTGLHLASQERHQGALSRFLDEAKTFSRDDDLIFLRTSVPGHGYCQRKDLRPYGNIHLYTFDSSHYEPKGSQLLPPYSLSLQADFNHNVLAQAKEHGVHVLDVFPMTLLRPDGHLAEDPTYRGAGIPEEDW